MKLWAGERTLKLVPERADAEVGGFFAWYRRARAWVGMVSRCIGRVGAAVGGRQTRTTGRSLVVPRGGLGAGRPLRVTVV